MPNVAMIVIGQWERQRVFVSHRIPGRILLKITLSRCATDSCRESWKRVG
jgi:hypothetical protein